MTRAMFAVPICAGVLALAGCGSDGGARSSSAKASTPPAKPTGTLVQLKSSEFGKVLFDGRGQAIYVFTKDARNRTRCFGACARAWPPVYTRGAPQVGPGVSPGLLGTIVRAGQHQVTYAGQPLYFYAHEGRNVVTCQNVDEFGGTWLAVQGSGQPVH